jgi:hypothetical protein
MWMMYIINIFINKKIGLGLRKGTIIPD